MNDLTLSEAYEKWANDLVGFATTLVGPVDAADVVADAFVELLDDRAGWGRVERPRAFLFGVVANRARMQVRSSARRRSRERRFGAGQRSRLDVTADGPGGAQRLFGQVSLQQRTFQFLAYWEDWPIAEIATHAGVSDGTVRKQLARARSKIREELS